MAISLTESAAQRVRIFLDRDGGVALRLGVRKTGCSGWAYTVDLADVIGANDAVFEQGDVKVIVDHDSLTAPPLISCPKDWARLFGSRIPTSRRNAAVVRVSPSAEP
jgi:iron-sulfur cluster assembly accessory protein